MQRKKLVELTTWAVWLLAVGGAGLWVVVGSIGYFSKSGWLPNDVAAWVQAIGSIVGIFAAVFIASADRRFTIKNTRAKEAVVIRAVRERCLEALGAIRFLNYHMRKHFEPVTSDSPQEVKKSLQDVEDVLRDLGAIDLMLMPNTKVVECVVMARGIVQYCRGKALEGWDPTVAMEVRQYSPLERILEQMESQIKQLDEQIESLRPDS